MNLLKTMNMFNLKSYGLPFILGGLMCINSSCTEKIEEETKATLEVTPNETIVTTNEGSKHELNVRTNVSNWVVLSDKDWVITENSGEKLTLTITPNNSTLERTASLQISAKDAVQQIIIQQSGLPTTLDIDKSKMNNGDGVLFGQFGGVKSFYIESNSKNWTARTSAKWLNVNQRAEQGEIIIDSEENKSREDRVGNIEFVDHNGMVINTLTITQKGILYYFLPYMTPGASEAEIKKFEEERYSKNPEGGSREGTITSYMYETVSPVFPLVKYVFNRGKYISATLYTDLRSSEPLQGEKKQEIIDFFTQNNIVEDGDDNSYFHEESNSEIKIVDVSVNPNISFKFIPKQMQDMPTFDTLPLDRTNFYKMHRTKRSDGDWDFFVDVRGDSAQNIIDGEVAAGWTLIPPYVEGTPEDPNVNFFERERHRNEDSYIIKVVPFLTPKDVRYVYKRLVFEKDGQYKQYDLGRVYKTIFDEEDGSIITRFICESGLERSIQTFGFENVNKFFYTDEDGDIPYMTKELKQLLKKEGFKYDNYLEKQKSYVYLNSERDLEISFSIEKTLINGDRKPRVIVVRVNPRKANAKY